MKKPLRPTSIKDIARIANVSHSTVSRALHNSSLISQETAERIRRIIDGRTTMPPHGTRDMPVWGQAFRTAGGNDPQGGAQADRLIDLLVHYLQSIQMD